MPEVIDGIDTMCVGVNWAELEGCRYRPTSLLDKVLADADLVQVVAGSPAWANLTRRFRGPVALQVATMAHLEREASLRGPGLSVAWRRLMTRWTARLDDRGLRCADLVFVENKRMRCLAADLVGHSRVILAYPGVDTERFSPAPSLNVKGPLIAVGRYTDPRKNPELLIDAYAGLVARSSDPPPLWVVSSRGLTARALSTARRRGVADRIRVLAGVDDTLLPDVYRQAGAFVLSSDEEGLGLVVLEAMASGLPVVSTDCVGPSESVVDGATGWLVPVGDAEALATALDRLLRDPAQMARMGAAGRARVLRDFCASRNAGQFLDSYRTVLGRRRP